MASTSLSLISKPYIYHDTITQEEILDNGNIIIRHEFDRLTKISISPEKFEDDVIVKETPVRSTKYIRRHWGPISWYQKEN